MGAPEVSAGDGGLLATFAARVIGARLAGGADEPPAPAEPALRRPAASFVTLERAGVLRGCIGTLDPVRPLYLDVARNALRAMTDPRLPAVTADEWTGLDVTVSVLSRPEPVPFGDLSELAGALRPGVDGVILTDGRRRATFLPAVWHKLPEPGRFVAALLAKGGWPTAAEGLTARRYTATEFRDAAPRPPLPAT